MEGDQDSGNTIMRHQAARLASLAAFSAIVAGITTSLPGVGLVLRSPAILGVLGLGSFALMLARNAISRAPKPAPPHLLPGVAALAIGVPAGGFLGALARDPIFWHYAPAYEEVIQRMAVDGRTGLLPTAELPLAARFCCRSIPAVYRDREGDPSMVTGYFEVAEDYVYHYQPPADPQSRTEYYGVDAAGTTGPPTLQSDVVLGECAPVGPRAQWCRVLNGAVR